MNLQERVRFSGTGSRKKGAVLGALVFGALGIMPGVSLGSTAALLVLVHLTGSPAEAGWAVRAAVVAGAFVGFVTAVVIGTVIGAAAGNLIDSLVRSLVQRGRETPDRSQRSLTVLPQGSMAAGVRADICARMAFLEDLRSSFHSLVVVGSAAHGALEQRSDYDVVLIGRVRHFNALEDAVAAQVIATPLSSRERAMEYTLLRPDEVRHLFQVGSPFAYAIRHGAVLQDDGFLRALAASVAPAVPGRTYALGALYERILIPYYGSFRALQQRAQKDRCSSVCCGTRRDCPGLGSAETAAKVILRMLYVTLPARGYAPLTKRDVIVHARREYGDESAAIVDRAVELCREPATPFCYTDLVRFRRFAGARFREILTIIGCTPALRSLLADGACVVQGRYGTIRDRNLRLSVAAVDESCGARR